MILSCSFLLLIMGFSWFCVSTASLDTPSSCLLSQLINHLHMIATDFMNIQKLLYISISRLVVILSGLWTCRSSKLADHSWAFQIVQLNDYVKILFSVIFNLQLLICLAISVIHHLQDSIFISQSIHIMLITIMLITIHQSLIAVNCDLYIK